MSRKGWTFTAAAAALVVGLLAYALFWPDAADREAAERPPIAAATAVRHFASPTDCGDEDPLAWREEVEALRREEMLRQQRQALGRPVRRTLPPTSPAHVATAELKLPRTVWSLAPAQVGLAHLPDLSPPPVAHRPVSVLIPLAVLPDFNPPARTVVVATAGLPPVITSAGLAALQHAGDGAASVRVTYVALARLPQPYPRNPARPAPAYVAAAFLDADASAAEAKAIGRLQAQARQAALAAETAAKAQRQAIAEREQADQKLAKAILARRLEEAKAGKSDQRAEAALLAAAKSVVQPPTHIMAMAEDAQGNLWVGCEDRGGLPLRPAHEALDALHRQGWPGR